MQAADNHEEKVVPPPRLERGTPRSTISPDRLLFSGGWNASPENPPEEHLPNDFCRTCSGKGYVTDQEYRPGVGTVSVSGRCWACDGTGWGK